MKSVDGAYKTCFVSILQINSIAKYKEAARAFPEVFLLKFCSDYISDSAHTSTDATKLGWKRGLGSKADRAKKGIENQG